ncbi:hypothetical protein J4219_05975 [Candidatus Woesearchaeota archaeon]|nr:hypothetical protein [Candidatus Woesearchaeota archaeon]
MKTCPKCETGKLSDVNDIVHDLEGYFFIAKGQRCLSCGEEYIPERELQPIIAVARRLGLWGQPLKLHRKLSKSARGTVLRIPADIERELNIKGDENVAISKRGRKIVIELE